MLANQLVAFLVCLLVWKSNAKSVEFCEIYHERVLAHVPLPLGNRIYASCTGCFERSEFPDLPSKYVRCPQIALKRKLGTYVKSKKQLWPHGVICHALNRPFFSSDQRNLIAEAMNTIEDTIESIKFITKEKCRRGVSSNELPATTCGGCRKIVSITKDGTNTCYSNVGMVAYGPQLVVLNDLCFKPVANSHMNPLGTIIHELGHTLGLEHENQHPKAKVLVLWNNVPDDVMSNYVREYDRQTTKYDPNSIMHYGEYPMGAEGVDGDRRICIPLPRCSTGKSPCIPDYVRFCDSKYHWNCIVATEAFCRQWHLRLGQRLKLSKGDRKTLRLMYPKASYAYVESAAGRTFSLYHLSMIALLSIVYLST